MKLDDAAWYSYHSLRSRKLRSWLTILGIIIGVASIVTLISLANGVNEQISSRLSGLGDRIITVTPGSEMATRMGGGFPGLGGGGGGFAVARTGGGNFGAFERQNAGLLTFDDASALERVEGVAAVDARIQGRVRVSFSGKNSSLAVVGVNPVAFSAMVNTPIVAGRTLGQNDRFATVLGYRVHNQTFREDDVLNRQLRVENAYSVRVVGLLNTSSGSLVVSDNSVYLPLDTARTVLNQSNPSQIIVLVKDGENPDEVAARLFDRLATLHRVPSDAPDFTITTASFLQSTIGEVTNLLALFLGGIAAISLIVGGIGVANTMFMSVLERTREVGILKALGMRDSEILLLFLFEAAAIGLVGGLIGVLLSFALSGLLGVLGVPSRITLELVALGLFFSMLVGIVSGVVPARNAARLEPVEALRYE